MNYIWDNIFRRKKENDLRSALRENLLFRDLSDRELGFVASIVHFRRYHTGEHIFTQGEIGVGMYIIIKGRVDITVIDVLAPPDADREIFITQLHPGDFFGELSLVEDNGLRTATAIAREETSLIGFFKPDLNEILSRKPSTGTKIVMRLAEVLGHRLKETTDKVSELRNALKELRAPPPTDSTNDTSVSI